jgi:GntR family transcriptional regulator
MQITIDIESPEPLFAQLIAQIKQAVQQGYKKPGDALPSIRQLANDLNLNNKTVAKAYRLLERDSVIQARGYRGTFVHPDAVENSLVDLSEVVTQKLTDAISTLRENGATDSEIRVAFAAIMSSDDA